MILKYAMKFLLTVAKHDKDNRKVYLCCWQAMYKVRLVNEIAGYPALDSK